MEEKADVEGGDEPLVASTPPSPAAELARRARLEPALLATGATIGVVAYVACAYVITIVLVGLLLPLPPTTPVGTGDDERAEPRADRAERRSFTIDVGW